MAIFLDGVNDFYFFQQMTAMTGYLGNALSSINREIREARMSRSAANTEMAEAR